MNAFLLLASKPFFSFSNNISKTYFLSPDLCVLKEMNKEVMGRGLSLNYHNRRDWSLSTLGFSGVFWPRYRLVLLDILRLFTWNVSCLDTFVFSTEAHGSVLGWKSLCVEAHTSTCYSGSWVWSNHWRYIVLHFNIKATYTKVLCNVSNRKSARLSLFLD